MDFNRLLISISSQFFVSRYHFWRVHQEIFKYISLNLIYFARWIYHFKESLLGENRSFGLMLTISFLIEPKKQEIRQAEKLIEEGDFLVIHNSFLLLPCLRFCGRWSRFIVRWSLNVQIKFHAALKEREHVSARRFLVKHGGIGVYETFIDMILVW